MCLCVFACVVFLRLLVSRLEYIRAGGRWKIFLLHIFLVVCCYSCIIGFGSPNAGEKLEHFVGLFVDLVLLRCILSFSQVAVFYAGKGESIQNILR